ncbi:MAG: hypothetical protein ABSB28_08930 [Candidatus Bathyarchaeia archaeon]
MKVFALSAMENLAKARRNREILLNYLLKLVAQCPEWVAVVAFYSALHFVDAYYAKLGIHFQRHVDRNKEVAESLQDIFDVYYNLYDISVNSRYGCVKDNPTEEEANDLVNKDLPAVAKFIEGLVH